MELEVIKEVPANYESIYVLDEFCKESLIKTDFKEWKRLYFAVHEAIINSVEATIKNCERPEEKTIKLRIFASTNEAEVHIIDQAGGIPDDKIEKLEERSLEDVLFGDNGRGILLIKELVDKVWQEKEEGNVLKLYKKVKEV